MNANSKMSAEMNGSVVSAQQKCLIYNLGKFWFSTDSMTNILSLSNAANKHRFTIETSAERTMKVYFSKKIAKFIELGNRL